MNRKYLLCIGMSFECGSIVSPRIISEGRRNILEVPVLALVRPRTYTVPVQDPHLSCNTKIAELTGELTASKEELATV